MAYVGATWMATKLKKCEGVKNVNFLTGLKQEVVCWIAVHRTLRSRDGSEPLPVGS